MPKSRYQKISGTEWNVARYKALVRAGKRKPGRIRLRSKGTKGSVDASIYKHYFKYSRPTSRYYVYLLQLKDGSYYVGMTQNVIARLLQHKGVEQAAYIVREKGYKRLVETWEFYTKELAAQFEVALTQAWHNVGEVYGGPYCGRTFLYGPGY